MMTTMMLNGSGRKSLMNSGRLVVNRSRVVGSGSNIGGGFGGHAGSGRGIGAFSSSSVVNFCGVFDHNNNNDDRRLHHATHHHHHNYCTGKRRRSNDLLLMGSSRGISTRKITREKNKAKRLMRRKKAMQKLWGGGEDHPPPPRSDNNDDLEKGRFRREFLEPALRGELKKGHRSGIPKLAGKKNKSAGLGGAIDADRRRSSLWKEEGFGDEDGYDDAYDYYNDGITGAIADDMDDEEFEDFDEGEELERMRKAERSSVLQQHLRFKENEDDDTDPAVQRKALQEMQREHAMFVRHLEEEEPALLEQIKRADPTLLELDDDSTIDEYLSIEVPGLNDDLDEENMARKDPKK